MGIRILLGLLILLASSGVESRPISHAGGYTLSARSDSLRDGLYLHYSPSPRYSLGIEAVNDKVSEEEYAWFRLAWLLHRKNTSRSQRNLYLHSGFSHTGFFYGVTADWETRRLFVGLGYRKTVREYEEKYLQLGFAPYLGDYGQLHSWLMMKIRQDTVRDRWVPHPVLKMFRGNTLMEIGYGDGPGWDLLLTYLF